MKDQLFEIIDDEDEQGVQRVGRLSDMDTREVSVVDRAANKRRFLVIKKDGEEGAGMADLASDQTAAVVDDATTQTGSAATVVEATVVKSRLGDRLQEALERVLSLKNAVSSAPGTPEQTKTPLPNSIGREIRAIQMMLRGLKGRYPSPTARAQPMEEDEEKANKIPTPVKAAVNRLLTEAVERLRSLKNSVGDSKVLDPSQAKGCNAVADLLGGVLRRYPSPAIKTTKVSRDSVSECDRVALLGAIEKATFDLMDLEISLRSETESDTSASTEDVSKLAQDIIDDFARGLPGYEEKAKKPEDEMTEEKAKKPDEECKQKKPEDEKYPEGKRKEPPMADEEKAKKPKDECKQGEKPWDEKYPEGKKKPMEEDDLKKIGRPMQGDRLNRLKGAVGLLKEALNDLRSGSVSLEKFKGVGAVLTALIDELSTQKRGAAAKTGGVEDKRSTSPENPNQGSGVQPDQGAVAGTEAISDSAELNSILKRFEALEAEVAKRDETISTLRGEVQTLKKRRVAPSAGPDDGSGEAVKKQKGFYWPRDMAEWDPEE